VPNAERWEQWKKNNIANGTPCDIQRRCYQHILYFQNFHSFTVDPQEKVSPILTKPASTQHHYVQVSYNKFNKTQIIHVKNSKRNSVMTLNKLQLHSPDFHKCSMTAHVALYLLQPKTVKNMGRNQLDYQVTYNCNWPNFHECHTCLTMGYFEIMFSYTNN
jgi:hypothetical protein